MGGVIMDKEKNKIKTYWNIIFNNIAEGVCLHKIIYEGNTAVDYKLLKVNKQYTNLIGFSKEDAEGAYASELYRSKQPPYLERYVRVAEKNKTEVFETYYAPLDKYCSIKVISPQDKYFITFFKEITKEKKNYQELMLKDFLIDNAGFGVFWLKPNGSIKYANKKICENLKYTKQELQELKIPDIDPMYPEEKKKEAWRKLKKLNTRTFKTVHKTSEEKLIPAKVTSQYINYRGREYEFAFIVDITEQKKKEREIRYNLYHDYLTGLFNSKYIDKKAEEIDENTKATYSIIAVDINGLKMINNIHSYKKGNEVIIKTAEILRSVIGKENIVARNSGDEFLVCLPNAGNLEAEKLISKIELSFKSLDYEITINLGLGYATQKNGEKFYKVFNRAIRNMHKHKLLEGNSSINNILENSLNILGEKSHETREHVIRLSSLANKLGEKLELSLSELYNLRLLAKLHDIGKTFIPEEILNKPGDLTDQEWKIMKEHPERGARVAAESVEFENIAEEILYHHEYWNGEGYPEGLKGEEIPLLSRIISIVDAYDVMTNERPYTKALTKKEAIQELINCAGSQFDPELVKMFISIIE